MRIRTPSLLAGITVLVLINGQLLIARTAEAEQAGAGGVPAPLLTLRQALDLALRNNRQITITGLQVEQAKQRVAAARTNLLPQFNIQAVGGELLDTVSARFPK